MAVGVHSTQFAIREVGLFEPVLRLATVITNRFRRTNRIVLALTPSLIKPAEWTIHKATLMREESRGGHFRSDFPKAKRSWAGRHIEW